MIHLFFRTFLSYERRKCNTVFPVPRMLKRICFSTPESGFHALHRGSWRRNLDANGSRYGCANMLQSLEKLKYLVLFWIALGVSWLPVRMYIQSTEKVNRHCNWFAKKVVLNGLADIQEFFVMCTLHFQMIWKRILAVFRQINCYIWWSFGEC